jgi:hypothetical protein
MPYTVHTIDGQAHTYPAPYSVQITDAGQLSIHSHGFKYVDGEPTYGVTYAVYPPGLWTHYHVEPAPYETDAQASEDTVEARQKVEGRLTVSAEEKDKWQASFQRYLDAGRKAAEAQ